MSIGSKKQISLFIVVCMVFSMISNCFDIIVKAEDVTFSQGDGYNNYAYDLSAPQPSTFNWNRSSRFSGPAGPLQKWTFKTGAAVESSPAISKDGIIYIGSDDNYLYALDLSGNLKWKYKTEGKVIASPAIDKNGIIYAVSDNGKLYAFNNAGILQWSVPAAAETITSSPAIAADGTIYFGGLHAVNPNGSTKWSLNISVGQSSPAIAKDGTIYIGSKDGKLYAVKADGTQKWAYTIGAPIVSSPAIADDGTIYIPSEDSYVYAVNADGTLKWKFKAGSSIQSSPAIDKSGSIYFGCDDGNLYVLASNGTLKWKQPESNTGSAIKSTPLIDLEGTIYVDNIKAVNKDGSLKWSIPAGTGASSVAISSNGLAILGSDDGTIYAIGEGGSSNVMVQSFNVSDIDSNTKSVSGVLKNITANSTNSNLVIEGYDSTGKLLSISNSSVYVYGNSTNTFQSSLSFGSRISEVKVYVLDKIPNNQMSIREFNEVTDSNGNKKIIGLLENGTANSAYANVIYEGYDSSGNLIEIKNNKVYINSLWTNYFEISESSKNVARAKVYIQNTFSDGIVGVQKYSFFKNDGGNQSLIGIIGNGTGSSAKANLIIQEYDNSGNLIEIKNDVYSIDAGSSSVFNYTIASPLVTKVNVFVQPAYSDGKVEVKKTGTFKNSNGNQCIVGYIGNGTSSYLQANLIVEGYDNNGNLIEIKNDTYGVDAGVTSNFNYTMNSPRVTTINAYVQAAYTDNVIEVKKSNEFTGDDGKQHVVGIIGNGTNSSQNVNLVVKGYDSSGNLIEVKSDTEYIGAGLTHNFDYTMSSAQTSKISVNIISTYKDGKVEVKESGFSKGTDGVQHLTGFIGNGTNSSSNANFIAECYDTNGNLIELKNDCYYISAGNISSYNYTINSTQVTKVNAYVQSLYTDGKLEVKKSNFFKDDDGNTYIIGIVGNGTSSDANVNLMIQCYDTNGNLIEIENNSVYVSKGNTSIFKFKLNKGTSVTKTNITTLSKFNDGIYKVQQSLFGKNSNGYQSISGIVSNGKTQDSNVIVVGEGCDSNGNRIEIGDNAPYVYAGSTSNFSVQFNGGDLIKSAKAYAIDTPVDGSIKVLNYAYRVQDNSIEVTGLISNGTDSYNSTSLIMEGYDKSNNLVEVRRYDAYSYSHSVSKFENQLYAVSQIDHIKVYTMDNPSDGNITILKYGGSTSNNQSTITALIANGKSTSTSANVIIEGYDNSGRLIITNYNNVNLNANSVQSFPININSASQISSYKVYIADSITSGVLKFSNTGVRIQDGSSVVSTVVGNGFSTSGTFDIVVEGYDANNKLVEVKRDSRSFNQNSYSNYEIQLPDSLNQIKTAKVYTIDKDTSGNLDVLKYGYRIEGNQLLVTSIIGNGTTTQQDTGIGVIAYDENGGIIAGGGTQASLQPGETIESDTNVSIGNKTVKSVEVKILKNSPTSNDENNKPENNPDGEYATRILDLYYSHANPDFDSFYGGYYDDGPYYVDPYKALSPDDPDGFVSLPVGSYAVLGFNKPASQSIFVKETGAAGDFGEVLVSSDDTNYTSLGIAITGTVTQFNLADLGYSKPVTSVKVVGLDNNGSCPGFDLVKIWTGKKVDYCANPITGAEAEKFKNGYNPSTQDPSQKAPDTNQGEPIDTSTGAHYINRTLLTEQGTEPMKFIVDYNSLLLNNDTLGKGWSNNFETKLEVLSNNNVLVHWSANRVNKFLSIYDGSYIPSDYANRFDKLVHNSDGTYTLTTNDQEKYMFNAQGQFVKKVNKNGLAIDLSYDSSGKLTTITDELTKHYFKLHYNANGYIDKLYDNSGRQVTFTYDNSGNLTGIVDPMNQKSVYSYDSVGRVISAVGQDGTRMFYDTYDSNGRVIKQLDPLNKITLFNYDESSKPGNIITTMTERNGNTKVLTHDYKYRLLSVKDETGNIVSYGYDDNDNCISQTDGNNKTTSYTFDKMGNVLTITDADKNTTTMTYDDNNNLLTMTNAQNKSIDYRYDNNNNITELTDALGNSTNYTYDSNNLLSSKTDPKGGAVYYYYKLGLLSKIVNAQGNATSYDYDGAGRTIAVTDSANGKTKTYYNADDNIVKVTDPLGKSVTYTYDCYNNKLSQTDALGNTTSYTYDSFGKVIALTDSLKNVTKYEYDAEQHLIKTTDPRGNATSYTVDGKGRVLAITDALGNTIRTSYDGNDNIISKTDALGNNILSVTYDDLNNPIKSTDGLGRTTVKQYDSLNRVTDITDPMGSTTKLTYDENNRLTSAADASGAVSSQSFDNDGNADSVTDSDNNTTIYSYDNAGRISSKTNASNAVTSYYYDLQGHLTKIINGRNEATTFTYDADGRTKTLTDPLNTISYTYDANGKITSITENNSTISKKYDSLGRLTSYTDNSGKTLQYQYDANSNITAVTYPDGKVVKYDYDAANRLTKVTDWASRATQYLYDANGRVLKEIRADGTNCSYGYDAMGQVTSINDVDAAGNKINSYTYSYDNNGNVINETSSFEQHNISVQSSAMTFTTDNRIDTYNNKQVKYDAEGNMTYGPLNGLMTNYSYDSRNRLVEAGSTVYNYDAENHRTSIVENGLKTSYVINPNTSLSQVLVKTDSQNVNTYYIYGLGLIAQDGADGYKTYHYDKNGSTTAITDKNGNVTDRVQYEPYGKITYRSGNTNSPFLYVGRYGVMADNNGLYYMRARYYNPELRRFINQDVVEGNIQDSQSLNQFAYTKGNPLLSIDPNGRTPWILASAVLGAVYCVGSQVVTDIITGQASDFETYAGQLAGGFVGGAVAGATGDIYAASAAYAVTNNVVKQSAYYIGDKINPKRKAKFDLEQGLIDTGLDFATNVIGGKAGDSVLGEAGLHNAKWANKVIKHGKAAFFGEHASVELWQKGFISADIATIGGIFRAPHGNDSYSSGNYVSNTCLLEQE